MGAYQNYFQRHAAIWASWEAKHLTRTKRESMLEALRKSIPTIERRIENEQAENS